MLFALALLFSAAFATGCVEPVAGSPVDASPFTCDAATTSFSCDTDLSTVNPLAAEGSLVACSCPCSCPGDYSCPESCGACADEQTTLSNCVQTCMANGGTDSELCAASDCTEQMTAYSACTFTNCMDMDDMGDDDDGSDWMSALMACTACQQEVTDMVTCYTVAGLSSACAEDCEDDYSLECEDCQAEQCEDETKDATVCAYSGSCMDVALETCAACSEEEGDALICVMQSTCDAEDVPCLKNDCAAEIEAMAGCSYDCEDASTYDVWFTTSFCNDGTDCASDCTLFEGQAVTFDTCVDEGDSSWMATCNTADNSVSLSQYDTVVDCSGTATNVVAMTNGMCGDDLDNDPAMAGKKYKYEWFGDCGGDEYVAPGSSSSLFVVVAFILSVILY